MVGWGQAVCGNKAPSWEGRVSKASWWDSGFQTASMCSGQTCASVCL